MKNQKIRSMKVHEQSGYNYKATPTIILKGQWLGDPILFNESERFMPVLYNNLKGKIVDISLDEEEDCIKDVLHLHGGTNVGLPGGLYTSSPNSSSNFFFPSIVLMAVMLRSFFSYGS